MNNWICFCGFSNKHDNSRCWLCSRPKPTRLKAGATIAISATIEPDGTVRVTMDDLIKQLAQTQAERDAAEKRAEEQWHLKVERSGDYVRAIEERDIALATCTELAETAEEYITFTVTNTSGYHFTHYVTCGGCGERVRADAPHQCNDRQASK